MNTDQPLEHTKLRSSACHEMENTILREIDDENTSMSKHLKVGHYTYMQSLSYKETIQGFLQFKECRRIKFLKESPLQMNVHAFREHVHSADHFCRKVHRSIFLFILPKEDRGDGGGKSAMSRVRGFMLGENASLKEETDCGIVNSAWNEFQRSPSVKHALDQSAQFENMELFKRLPMLPGEEVLINKLRRDLYTRVSVNTYGVVSSYKSSTCDMDDDDEFAGMRDDGGLPLSRGAFVPWGPVHAGRLCFQYSCNVVTGSLQVPLVMPMLEIVRKEQHIGGRKRNRPVDPDWQEEGADVQVEAMEDEDDTCNLLRLIRMDPIMPAGWYRNNIVGARIHCIEMGKHKARIVCETSDWDIFRFKDCFPDRPVSKAERKGVALIGSLDDGGEQDVDDTVHDDMVSSPGMALAEFAHHYRDLMKLEQLHV